MAFRDDHAEVFNVASFKLAFFWFEEESVLCRGDKARRGTQERQGKSTTGVGRARRRNAQQLEISYADV